MERNLKTGRIGIQPDIRVDSEDPYNAFGDPFTRIQNLILSHSQVPPEPETPEEPETPPEIIGGSSSSSSSSSRSSSSSSRSSSSSSSSPPPDVFVDTVYVESNFAVWEFSSAVIGDPTEIGPGLQCSYDEFFMEGVSVSLNSGKLSITYNLSGNEFQPGEPWRVNADPGPSLQFANGGILVVPQNGLTEPL